MKKILSLLFSAMMLVSAVTAIPFEAYAENPKIKVGEIFNISYKSNTEANASCAISFVPDSDGMYEFEFSNLTPATGKQCMYAFIYSPPEYIDISNGSARQNYGVSDGSGGAMQVKDDYPRDLLTVADEFKKGVKYSLMIKISGFKEYSADITVKKGHECKTYDACRRAVYSIRNDYTSDGYISKRCLACGEEQILEKLYGHKKGKLSKSTYVYNGKAKAPKLTICDRMGNVIDPSCYDVLYSKQEERKNATADEIKDVGYGYVHYKFICKERKGSGTVCFKIVPQSTTISSITPQSKGFEVEWKKQATQTDGYQIKYSTNKDFKDEKYVTVKGTKNISKTIKNLKAYTKYYIKVRTYKDVNGERFYSFWSSTKSVTTNQPKGTELTSVSAQSKGFKAKWKKQSGIKGYQIKYSTASDFKNAKYVTVKSADSSAKAVKNLKGNKKYFVKVRTYKIVDGKKCYSQWSEAKTVTTKK